MAIALAFFAVLAGPAAAATWTDHQLPSVGQSPLFDISCPSTSLCVAVGGGNTLASSTNPTGPAAGWSVAYPGGEGPPNQSGIKGVSCPSPQLCVAVGDDGANIAPAPTDRGEILTSTDPLGGAWQRVEVPGTPGNLFGVSCPSPALCVTGNALGNLLVSTGPTGPATAWPATPGGGAVQLTAAECPSVTRCVIVDNNADVLTTTNPTGGPAAWTFTNLIPYTQTVGTLVSNAMWGASCPTVTFCAISAGDGQVFTSEDPFATTPEPARNGPKKHKKRRRKGPKRPRTTLAQRPFPAIELDGGKLTVRFGFFATKHASVRGFECKIDQRPLARCHSPKRYRVGAGRHRFRVRAIGWSGLKGPPKFVSFRVCHPPSPSAAPGPPCSHSSH